MKTFLKIGLTIVSILVLTLISLYSLYLLMVLYFFGYYWQAFVLLVALLTGWWAVYKADDWYEQYKTKQAIKRHL